MSDPFARTVTRVAYMATQLPRLAWYAGHDYVVRRLAAQAHRRDAALRPDGASPRAGNLPDQWRIYSDLADLLAQDLANVEAGIYPLPHDHDGTLFTRLRRSRLFFEDLPAIHRRRERNDTREVNTAATAAGVRITICRTSTINPTAGCRRIRPIATTRRLRCCSRVAPMRCAARRCRRSTRFSPVAINADCGCSTSLVARADFSTSSSRDGRGFQWSGSTCRRPTAGMRVIICSAGRA